MNTQSNFEKFIKDFPEYKTGKIKGTISVFLNIYYREFIFSLLQQGFTVKMVYLRLLKNEPSLDPYLNFNTLRSWVRKNIKNGDLNKEEFSTDSSNLSIKNSPLEENLTLKRLESVSATENLIRTTFDSESRVTVPNRKQIPSPQAPIIPANKEILKEITGYDLNEFYVDSNGYLFDGFSSDSIANLVPVPDQFQILAQQDGIKKHYFLYKKQTVDSKTILTFIKEKIRTGTLFFTFRKL